MDRIYVQVEGRQFAVCLYPRENSLGYLILETYHGMQVNRFSWGSWYRGSKDPFINKVRYNEWLVSQSQADGIKLTKVILLAAQDKIKSSKCISATVEDGTYSDQSDNVSETHIDGVSGWPDWLTFFFRCLIYCAGPIIQCWRSGGGVRSERHIPMIQKRLSYCEHCLVRGCCKRPCLHPEQVSNWGLQDFGPIAVDTKLWENLLTAEPFVRKNEGENRKEGEYADTDPVQIWYERRQKLIDAKKPHAIVKKMKEEVK